MPLPLRHPSSKRKAGAPDASELVLDAGFLAAYLQERRRQDPMAQEVRVYAVKDEGGNLVAFGLPCDWGDGVAEKVLIGDYSVETIGGFRGLDSRWASAPPQIISSNYKRRPFARSSGAEVEWKVDNAERKSEKLSDLLVISASFDKGVRSKMEDTHTVIPDFNALLDHYSVELTKIPSIPKGEYAYAAIFDGHSGGEASSFCRANLHTFIMKSCFENECPLEAMRKGIETADLEFLRVSCAGNPPYESGTTALSVLLSDRCMYIANVGDCRAVLCRAGKAIELTRDHKANSHEEKARIERNGGLVQFDMLNGHLAVSRALGGYDSESNSKIKGLTSEPDLFKLFLTEDDEFLILASDGLWDSFDSETVVRISRDSLLRNNDVSALTEKLLDDAISRGSEDNITIIIIGFNRYSPLTLERQIILPDFEVKRHWNHLSSPSLSKSVSNSSPDSRITKSSHCKLSTLGLNALRQALERQ